MLALKEKLKNLPKKPGIYLFKDKTGEVLYIGKAKNLKARVSQYFQGTDERPQIPFLLAEIFDVDYTVVNNELESLYLENTLIKEHLPKYNIVLRDDKNYAFIKIDYSTQIPTIGYARKIESPSPSPSRPGRGNSDHSDAIRKFGSRNLYFGPYSAAYKIRQALHLVRKIFPYCSAQKVGHRPCFHYYLHRCPGICIGKISLAEYQKQLDNITLFLSGNNRQIIRQLKTEMRQAARVKNFERAGKFRDQLRTLELLEQKQNMILTEKVDWDVVSLAAENAFACINLFKIRRGKLLDKENFIYETPIHDLNGRSNHESSKILQTFLENYYLETNNLPKKIYLEIFPKDVNEIHTLLASRSKPRIYLKLSQRGKARQLVQLGKENAKEYLRQWLSSQADYIDSLGKALEDLEKLLKLPSLPKRIEAYDISNLQGTNPVGSMVVFMDGKPAKNQYRKFKIQGKTTPDDFAMMREMLKRRFSHTKDTNWALPDLIVIDGGKGQLGVASKIMRNSKLKIPVIGLAKRIEEIFVPGKTKSIVLPHSQAGLQLLQRLRDEAHRFGIGFHRNLRSKQAVKSRLDDIAGVGPKTKKLLKQKFGTISNIQAANLEDLAKVAGLKLAQKIKQSI